MNVLSEPPHHQWRSTGSERCSQALSSTRRDCGHALENKAPTYVLVTPMLPLTEFGQFEPLLRAFISAFVILDLHFFATDVYFCHTRRIPVAIVGPQNIQHFANKLRSDSACAKRHRTSTMAKNCRRSSVTRNEMTINVLAKKQLQSAAHQLTRLSRAAGRRRNHDGVRRTLRLGQFLRITPMVIEFEF